MKIGLEPVAEGVADNFGFAFPHQPVIDVNAGDLWTDGLEQQGRADTGINAAGEAADHALVADPGLDLGHGPVDKCLHLPRTLAAAHIAEEVGQDLTAMRRMCHFRVK